MNLTIAELSVSAEVPPEVAAALRELFFWEIGEDTHTAWKVVAEVGPIGTVPLRAISEPGEFNESLTTWSSCGTSFVHVEATGGQVEVHRPARTILVRNPNVHGLFVDTYRVIRQVLLADALDRGYIPLHAAGVDYDGMAVAIVGDRGAGKTTLSAALCRRGGRYLGNDKLLVHPGNGRALHFFEAPAVTAATIQLLGVEDEYETLRRYPAEYSPTAWFMDHPPLPPLDSLSYKAFFSERQWTRLIGAEHVTASTVTAVVWLGGSAGDLSDHIDPMEPFPDWLLLRPSFPSTQRWQLPLHEVPRTDLQLLVERIQELMGWRPIVRSSKP